MNQQQFEEFNRKMVSGECPICGKVFIYRKAVFTHLDKEHNKINEEYCNKLCEV